MNKIRDWIDRIILGLFSLVLAMGTWNPFAPGVSEGEEPTNSFAQIVTVLLVGYLICWSFAKKTKVSIKWAAPLWCFTFVFTFSTIWGQDNLEHLPILLIAKLIIDILLSVYLFKHLVRYPQLISFSLMTFAISCAIISSLYVSGALDDYIDISSGRVMFFGENPNSTSSRIALGAIVLVYYVFVNPLGWKKTRFLLSFLLVPMLLMIASSGSRGSIIILVICVFLIILFGEYSKNARYIGISIMSILLLAFYALFLKYASELSVIERFLDIAEGNDAGRGELKHYAWEIFISNPVFGYGDSGFMREMYLRFNEDRTVHNLYYYILATSGLLGAIPFFYFLGYLAVKSYRIARRRILPIVLVVFVLLLVDKTGGVLTYSLVWYLFAIVLAYDYLLRTSGNGKNSNFGILESCPIGY